MSYILYNHLCSHFESKACIFRIVRYFQAILVGVITKYRALPDTAHNILWGLFKKRYFKKIFEKILKKSEKMLDLKERICYYI